MQANSKKTAALLPGAWIGVLGGGQLGRMLAFVAHRMGYHVAVADANRESPLVQVADSHFAFDAGNPNPDDSPLIDAFAKQCDVVTLEFENIDAGLVERLEQHTIVAPSADFLRLCQDRINEKTGLKQLGVPTTPFASILEADDVERAAAELGLPLVFKTARSGYDGKGQLKVDDAAELTRVFDALGNQPLVAEKWIEFDCEVSMVTARNATGEVKSYPLVLNAHANHILDVSSYPVPEGLLHLQDSAEKINETIAEQFDVVGLFCVEFFVSKEAGLIVNEIAPRPHNSGHLTIEGFRCSQFEQQLRAICNLPLAHPSPHGACAMVNLLGDLWEFGEPDWSRVLGSQASPGLGKELTQPMPYLHLYGKAAAKAGRKMGHLTVVDPTGIDSQNAVEMASQLRKDLCVAVQSQIS